MHICDFGCGCEAFYYFKSSQKWCCKKSPNSCDGKRGKDSEKKKGKNPWKGKKHPRGMLGKTHPFKNKSYEEIYGDIQAQEKREDASKKLKGKPSSWHTLTKPYQDTLREQRRERILKRYQSGWMPKAGRCKKYDYYSPIAGSVKLDGTWELKVAKWLDDQQLTWERNNKRFPYIHLNGKQSHYVPDFWVEEWNAYLEVKGYETKLDRCKWSQFADKLIIWKKNEIDRISEGGQDGNAADC